MAVIYIWPGATFNGDGTLPTQAAGAGLPGARNTPPTFTANNTYRFKRGTTYTNTSGLRPTSLTSAASTPLTIEPYFYDDGSDEPLMPRPIIDHGGGTNGTGAIYSDQCTNVVIRGMAATNSTASSCSGLRVRKGSNVKVIDCESYGNIYGIAVVSTSAVLPGTETTDVEIRGNITRDNQGSGIWWQYGDASGERIRRLSIVGNTVYGNGTGSSANRRGGIMHQCERATGAGNADSHTTAYGCYDLVIDKNEVFNNYSYGIAIYSTYNDTKRSRVTRNHVYGNGVGGLIDTHPIWVGGSRGVLVERNDVHDNIGWTNGSVGSSCGILLDFNANVSAVQPTGGDHIVRRNRVYNGWRGPTNASIPSDGILIISNESCRIESNLVYNCMNGITNSGTSAQNNVYRGNTVVNIRAGSAGTNQTGHGFITTNGANSSVYGNIFANCDFGIHSDTSGPTGFSEQKNIVFNCTQPRTVGTVAVPTGTSLHASDLTTDPLLGSDYGPLPSSPALAAGLAIASGAYWRDYSGRQRRRTPSIGALDMATLRRA